jgi:hypothetical protein
MTGSLYADKKFTIKGIYQPDTQFNFNTSGTLAGGIKDESDGSYDVEGGFGLGAEISAYSNDRLEILGGVNYILTRKIDRLSLTETLSYGGQAVSGRYEGPVADDSKLDVTSLYVKPRYFLEKPSADNVAIYIAGSLSYNLVSIKIGNAGNVKAKDGFGFGLSAGIVVNDLIDLEAAYNIAVGDFLLSDETNDWKGTYNLPTLSLAAGLRF